MPLVPLVEEKVTCFFLGDSSRFDIEKSQILTELIFYYFWLYAGNLAMSYTALSTLVCLGDDLSRVDKKGLIEGNKRILTSMRSRINNDECRIIGFFDCEEAS